MTCQIFFPCTYEFCWICGRKYNGNYVFSSECACTNHPEDEYFKLIPLLWHGTEEN